MLFLELNMVKNNMKKEITQSVIWTMWWQGESNAPPTVKACIHSMRKNSGNHPVIVLDQSNYKKYVALPQYIEKKREKGVISLTHFSDIIRINLLNTYGGLWLDSTIYVNRQISEEVFEKNFYTVKMNMPNKGISNNQWCGFLLGWTAHNVIFEEQAELLCRYWKNEDELVDYLLIDYFFYIIFNEIKQANRELDEVTEYAGNVLKMQEKMAETTYEVSDFPIFSKLNWKSSVELSNDGKLTLYQKILLDSGIVDDSQEVYCKDKKYKRKIKSALRHFRKFIDRKRIKKYGFGIQFYGLANDLLRTSNGKCAYFFAKQYQNLVLKYLRRYCGAL